MARPNTKRLLPILLATAARALLPPRQHRISMRRAPCQPKRRRTKAPNAAARTAPTRQPTALSASNDGNVGKQGAVIVDAEAEFVDGAAGPAAAAEPQPPAMDAVTLVAVAAPPATTKTKKDKKRQQNKSPQSLKVAAATIALAATAPVPTTLFAWHPALAALSLPLAAAAGVVVAGPQPVFYPTGTPSTRREHAIDRRDVKTQAAPPPRSAPRARTAARRSSAASSCTFC